MPSTDRQGRNLENAATLGKAVQKGLQDLVEAHRCTLSEFGVVNDPRDDDEESPGSFNSIDSSPSVYLEAELDMSGFPPPPGHAVCNTSNDLTSTTLLQYLNVGQSSLNCLAAAFLLQLPMYSSYRQPILTIPQHLLSMLDP